MSYIAKLVYPPSPVPLPDEYFAAFVLREYVIPYCCYQFSAESLRLVYLLLSIGCSVFLCFCTRNIFHTTQYTNVGVGCLVCRALSDAVGLDVHTFSNGKCAGSIVSRLIAYAL